MLTTTARNPMDRVHADIASDPYGTPVARAIQELPFVPPVDVVEGVGEYVVTFDLPGIADDDVSVHFDGRVLIVSGHRTGTPGKTPLAEVRRQERRQGAFKRLIVLPSSIATDAATVSHWNGVLIVTVPKSDGDLPARSASSRFFRMPCGYSATAESPRPYATP